jgi:hypothetical protein
MNYVYVVSARLGCAIFTPRVYSTFDKAYDRMKKDYREAIEAVKDDGDKIDWRYCNKKSGAIIATEGDWYEWVIRKVEVL